MDTIIESGPKHFFYSAINSASAFQAPPCPAPFACMLWNAEGQVEDGERALLSRHLIHAGCTFLVAGGVDCEAWHDAADREFLNLDLTGSEYDRRFVVTSWHHGESFEEVAFFLAQCAMPPVESGIDEYQGYLVLQYGGDFTVREQLFEAVREAADGDDGEDDHVA